MVKGLIGRKLGMTRIFDKDGINIPVTLLEMGPCTVVQVKTADGKDGYNSVQLGFEPLGADRINQPMTGHYKKAGVKGGFRVLREFRLDSAPDVEPGAELTVEDVFKEAGRVKVTGTSSGKGFAGAMKRHGFHGSPASHGAKRVHRRPMSAGATDAARVFKGKRSPGQMGNVQVSQKNCEIVRIKPLDAPAPAEEPEKKDGGEQAEKKEKGGQKSGAKKFIIALKGCIPGKPKSLVILENM